MKKRILSLLLVLLMVVSLVPISASAASNVVTYAVEGGNITFNKTTGSVTKCDNTVTEANIPSYISNVKVKSIGDYAFQNCASLENVIIPDGVSSIGDQAFYGCKKLKSITMPNSLKYRKICIR